MVYCKINSEFSLFDILNPIACMPFMKEIIWIVSLILKK